MPYPFPQQYKCSADRSPLGPIASPRGKARKAAITSPRCDTKQQHQLANSVSRLEVRLAASEAKLAASDLAKNTTEAELRDARAQLDSLQATHSTELRKVRRELMRMMLMRSMDDEQMELLLREHRPKLDAQIDELMDKMYGEDGTGGQLPVLAKEVLLNGGTLPNQQLCRLA